MLTIPEASCESRDILNGQSSPKAHPIDESLDLWSLVLLRETCQGSSSGNWRSHRFRWWLLSSEEVVGDSIDTTLVPPPRKSDEKK